MPYESHFLERYTEYKQMLSWTKLRATLELAYEQDHNENVLVGLRMINDMQEEVREKERRMNEADVDEIRRNPGKYPSVVVDWVFNYRDKEIS